MMVNRWIMNIALKHQHAPMILVSFAAFVFIQTLKPACELDELRDAAVSQISPMIMVGKGSFGRRGGPRPTDDRGKLPMFLVERQMTMVRESDDPGSKPPMIMVHITYICLNP